MHCGPGRRRFLSPLGYMVAHLFGRPASHRRHPPLGCPIGSRIRAPSRPVASGAERTVSCRSSEGGASEVAREAEGVRCGGRSRTNRSTEWRPRDAGWKFRSQGGAALGELGVRLWCAHEQKVGHLQRREDVCGLACQDRSSTVANPLHDCRTEAATYSVRG